jgi:hypothetical protein
LEEVTLPVTLKSWAREEAAIAIKKIKGKIIFMFSGVEVECKYDLMLRLAKHTN